MAVNTLFELKLPTAIFQVVSIAFTDLDGERTERRWWDAGNMRIAHVTRDEAEWLMDACKIVNESGETKQAARMNELRAANRGTHENQRVD